MRKILFIILINLLSEMALADGQFVAFSPDLQNNASLTKANEFSGFGCGQVLTGLLETCAPNSNIYNGLDCNGGNIAPQIKWTNPPATTRSFALTIFDPDMPTGSGWWHFAVYNIPFSAREIKGGKLPQDAAAAINDSGTKYYMGPCPPRKSGPHRYIFTVYALDIDKLDVAPTVTASLVSYVINQHKIASSTFVATYER